MVFSTKIRMFHYSLTSLDSWCAAHIFSFSLSLHWRHSPFVFSGPSKWNGFPWESVSAFLCVLNTQLFQNKNTIAIPSFVLSYPHSYLFVPSCSSIANVDVRRCMSCLFVISDGLPFLLKPSTGWKVVLLKITSTETENLTACPGHRLCKQKYK